MIIKDDIDRVIRFLARSLDSEEIVVEEMDIIILDSIYESCVLRLPENVIEDLDRTILNVLGGSTKTKNYCFSPTFRIFKDSFKFTSDRLRGLKLVYVIHKLNMVLDKYFINFNECKLKSKINMVDTDFLLDKVLCDYYDSSIELTMDELIAVNRSIRVLDAALTDSASSLVSRVLDYVSNVKFDPLLSKLMNVSLEDKGNVLKLCVTLSVVHKVSEKVDNYKLVK